MAFAEIHQDEQVTIRDRLLSVALPIFNQSGFEGASLQKIADAAGLTKGAIFSNFKGKDDLFLACLRLRTETMILAFRRHSAEVPRQNRLPLLIDFIADTILADLGWSLLFAEFLVYASRRPALLKALAKVRSDLRDEVMRAYRDARSDIVNEGEIERRGTLLFAMINGVSIEAAVDRSRVTRIVLHNGISSVLN